jgi:cytochrome P450
MIGPFFLLLILSGFIAIHHGCPTTCIILALISAIPLFFIWKIYLRRLSSPLKRLPGPKTSYTVLGDSKAVFNDPLGRQIYNWIERLPNKGMIFFRGSLGSEYVVPTSVEALTDVLCHHPYDFTKTGGFRNFTDRFIGQGLLTAEGDFHRQLVRLSGPVFIERRISHLKPIMSLKAHQLCRNLLDELSRVSDSPKQPDYEVIDFAPWASRVALDIAGIVALGVDYDTIRYIDSPIFAAYQDIFSSSDQKKAHFMWHNSAPRFLSGLMYPNLDKHVDNAINFIRRTVKQIAEENARTGKTSSSLIELDFMSQIISSKAFKLDVCVEQTILMLSAGHETTSASICWLVLELARNPSVQKDLRAEVLSFIRHSSMDSTDLDNLPLLDAVCHEMFRLHPGVPMTVRKSIHNTYIQNQYIPAGTYIPIVPEAINKCTEFWGENAEEFYPERWLKRSEDGIRFDPLGGTPSKLCFQTFLHGPRGCIGRPIAVAEIKRVIAALLTHFEILPGSDSIPEGSGIIASHPKGGALIQLRKL